MVSVRLRGMWEYLRPAQRKVARIILEDPESVASMSIGALASAANVSEATVVRLAHTLNLNGYQALRFQIACEVGARERDKQFSRGDVEASDGIETVASKLAQAIVDIISDSLTIVDPVKLAEAIEICQAAKRIDIYGTDCASLVATALMNGLTRIGKNAVCFTALGAGINSAVMLSDQDVALALSASGRTKDTLTVTKIAAEKGAKTIAITANADSELAQLCDLTLVTAMHPMTLASEVAARHTSALFMTGCLVAGLAQCDFQAAKQAIAESREILNKI